ncbi:MAG: nuclear transport factor 2 family protein [Chitinophagales bacterium]|nr:nuclear transport factor 2 family protein [Chitinophagales bacterium]
MTIRSITILILTFSMGMANAQVSKNSDLFLALKQQDSIFFERGFNLCDLDYLNQATHADLVFYHDQGGVQNKSVFMENTKKYICSDPGKKPIRKVVVESLEVFPMYENGVLYGVIQTGIHDFYIREKEKADVHTSRAKFIHLYLLEDGNWVLKEVLSFDHK